MTKSIGKERDWKPMPHPDWVQTVNEEGRLFDLQGAVPLDEESLLTAARRETGLEDFGEGDWQTSLGILLNALETEAELTLVGRLMARNDILLWLQVRLNLTALWHQTPAILKQPVERPVFILGLPRSGTSILCELLAQDPRFRVPASWEALFPCPLPTGEETASDPRVQRADGLLCQWARVAPEYQSMHEMGGLIPCECGLIMSPTFISDHIASHYQAPSYHAYLAETDMGPVYAYHRRFLQSLQWKKRAEHWLLKAPNHLAFLPELFAEYPDARIIQTHRDPLKCMASTANLLGTLYWMRSDKPFDVSAFEDIVLGEATATRLENAARLREEGKIPAAQFLDSRYQDLMEDPVATLHRIYTFLEMDFSPADASRVEKYLHEKPKGKFGAHAYEDLSPETAAQERPLFRAYQERFSVPDEI